MPRRILLAAVVLTLAVGAAEENFGGTKTEWRGFARYDLKCEGRPLSIIAPKEAAAGKPWVWRVLFFDHKPEVDVALVSQGFHLVYLETSDMYGSPTAMAEWNAAYKLLTDKHGFAKKVALEALSRAGLLTYRWASAHPERIACIYADAPVCDFKSWPAGKGKGKGSKDAWQTLLAAYKFTEEEALKFGQQPVDSSVLKPIVDAKIPLLHVCGDADDVVPLDENTLVLKERVEKLGGSVRLIVKKGVGHHPHGLDDPKPIIDFILEHAKAAK